MGWGVGALSLGSSLSAAALFPQSAPGFCVSSLPSGLLQRNGTHLAKYTLYREASSFSPPHCFLSNVTLQYTSIIFTYKNIQPSRSEVHCHCLSCNMCEPCKGLITELQWTFPLKKYKASLKSEKCWGSFSNWWSLCTIHREY